MNLISQVKTTIANHNLLVDGDKLVVGVSGGPDSLALLHILYQLQTRYSLQLHIAHVDHQLRGEASQQDAEFVAQLADEWELPSTIKTTDVKSYSQKEGLSLEDAARRVRYNFFADLREKLNFDKIAVAHHADDQVETILMKFIRGAGLKGLGGMKPKNNRIIRPLLETTKKQIKDYCFKHNLNPCVDETNFQPVQFRNKIRLELIPLLKEYNSNLVSTLTRNAQIWQDENEFLRDYAQTELEKLLIKREKKQIILTRDKLKQHHSAVQRRIIREAVKQLAGDYRDFYHQHLKELRELVLTGKTGSKLDLPRGIIAKLNYNQLIFMKEELINEPKYFKVKVSPGQEVKLSELNLVVSSKVVDSSYPWQEKIDDENKGFFDFNKIGSEFYIRQREDGDRFYPLGLAGSKKVKDLLIDEKIPRSKRDQIPIFITSKGNIFWVGELRIDERFKVTTSTEQILIVEINKLKEESLC